MIIVSHVFIFETMYSKNISYGSILMDPNSVEDSSKHFNLLKTRTSDKEI